MKKRIVVKRGRPYVERKAATWASILSALMFLAWIVAGLYAVANADVVAAFWVTLLLGVPSLVLSYTLGNRKRYRVKAVVEARTVPGGTHVVLLDDRGERHELVLREDVARGLALTLEDLSPRTLAP